MVMCSRCYLSCPCPCNKKGRRSCWKELSIWSFVNSLLHFSCWSVHAFVSVPAFRHSQQPATTIVMTAWQTSLQVLRHGFEGALPLLRAGSPSKVTGQACPKSFADGFRVAREALLHVFIEVEPQGVKLARRGARSRGRPLNQPTNPGGRLWPSTHRI